MDLLIGAPVSRRDWILPTWFEYVFAACNYSSISPAFLFVLDPTDLGTAESIMHSVRGSGCQVSFVSVPDGRKTDVRKWNITRYEHMVRLRNKLLRHVRAMEPNLFLSLDSDILIHEQAISNLKESMELQGWDAVGGRAYMTDVSHGRKWPSCGKFDSYNNLRRPDGEGVYEVDVIMAIKLMNNFAYNVDYEFSGLGEDIGWSKSVRDKGGKIGFDGRCISKHVMSPDDLHVIDPRVGY